jgi:hypothetical protein
LRSAKQRVNLYVFNNHQKYNSMKKLFIQVSAAAFLFAACSGGQDSKDGTHTHEDGTMHEHHNADSGKQEEFTVPADSSDAGDSLKEHSHDGHEHPHTH